MMGNHQIGLIVFAIVAISLALGLGLGLGLKNKEESTSSASSSASLTPLNLHAYKWIDLTHTFNESTSLYWPANPGMIDQGSFEFEEIFAGDTDECGFDV